MWRPEAWSASASVSLVSSDFSLVSSGSAVHDHVLGLLDLGFLRGPHAPQRFDLEFLLGPQSLVAAASPCPRLSGRRSAS